MKDAIIDFSDPMQRASFLTMTRQLNGRHRISIKKHRDRRSDAQNKYWFGVVIPNVAAGLEEAWGECLSDEKVHEYLKREFLSEPVVNRKTGECKGTTVNSSAFLDTKEFALLIDKVIRFAAESLNTPIPEADAAYRTPPNDINTLVSLGAFPLRMRRRLNL